MQVVIIKGEGEVVGVNLGHSTVTNCDLLHSCVKVHRPIELSFGVAIGVGLGIRILDGAQVPQGEWTVSGILFPHCFGGINGHFQAKHTKYSNVHIMETTAWIPSKFCILVKTSKCAL